MTGRCVALFRGINVGTAKRIAMADLRALFERLGYRDVRTLLNSGNVVFTTTKDPASVAPRIERAVAERLGVQSRVTVLTAKQLADAVGGNPLTKTGRNPSLLLILVPRDAAALSEAGKLAKHDWKPEALSVGKGAAYLWCANGINKSALWLEINRVLGDRGTSRNMATMTKLLALCDAAADA